MKKRFFAALLCLCLLAAALPTATLAADPHDHTGWTELTAESTQTYVSADGKYALGDGNYYLGENVQGDFTVDGTVTLCLNGYTITGTGSGSVITVNSGTFTLTDCSEGETGKVTGGKANGNGVNYGGGVYVKYSEEVYESGGATFILEGGSITGNTAAFGGGVAVENGNHFIMNGGSITDNDFSNSGGGVYVAYLKATFTMFDGTIANNIGTDEYTTGGGVYATSNFTMNGGTITGNEARRGGGGVYSSENFIMNGGSITGNTANALGGGVYILRSSSFTMDGGTISDNFVYNSGGGVYLDESGSFTMSSGTITGNSAGSFGGGVYSLGTFTMTGGSITGNNAGTGGGVYVGSDVGYGNSILTLSGAVQIKDNVCNGTKGSNGNYSGGTTSNVYLRSGKTITIGTNHLSSDASIGVTTQDLPTNEDIAIATGANLDDKQYFHSDTGENYLFYVTSDGTICMTTANAHGHPICGASCSHNGSSHTDQNWQPIGSTEELTAIQNTPSPAVRSSASRRRTPPAPRQRQSPL